VFVEKLQPGGPAEKVGIKPEDILTSINGKTIKKGQDLIDEVAETAVGNSVSISLLRDGKPETVKVTVGDRAKVFGADAAKTEEPKESPEENTSARFGISIQPLTPGMKQNMSFTGTGGVVVSTVEPGSFAEDIGLIRQDVIVAINRQPVNSIEDVQRIQKTLKNGDSVAMRVMRRVRSEWRTFYPAGKLGNTQ